MSKERPVPRWVKVVFWLWLLLPIGVSLDFLDYTRPVTSILVVIGMVIALIGPVLLIVLRYGKDAFRELYGGSKDGADSKDIANLVP